MSYLPYHDDPHSYLVSPHTKEDEHAQYKAMLESVGDGLIATDHDGRIVFVNRPAEAMLGWTFSELKERALFEVLPGEDDQGVSIPLEDRPIQIALRSGEKITSGVTTYYRRKNGATFPVAISITPIISEDKILGVIEVFRDITKELELQKMREEFVSLATHQLRAPITIIKGYSDMMLRDATRTLADEDRHAMGEIRRAGEQLLGLVNAMLNALRIEMGVLAIEPTLIDLREIADELVEAFHPIVSKKQSAIETRYDPAMPKISADQKLTHALFENLISNAVKYTPEGGTVRVVLEMRGEEAVFIVADTGCGIPKNQQRSIFKKLFRADNARIIDAEGTGLGLYIVKSILEQAGGRIWFESEEGKGSTFYIALPLAGMKRKEGVKGLS